MKSSTIGLRTLVVPFGANPNDPALIYGLFGPDVPAELAAFYAIESLTVVSVEVARRSAGNYMFRALVVDATLNTYQMYGSVITGIVTEAYRLQGNIIDASDVNVLYGVRNPVSAEFQTGLWLYTGAFSEQRFDAGAVQSFTTTGQLKYNSIDMLGAWQTWNPIWSSVSNPQPALGNGTLTGAVRIFGKTADIRWNLTAAGDGSTTFGTGNWQFTLPVTGKTGRRQLIPVMAVDNSSGGGNGGWARIEPGSNAVLRIHSPAGNFAAAAPFAWAASDSCTGQGTIEID